MPEELRALSQRLLRKYARAFRHHHLILPAHVGVWMPSGKACENP